MIIENLSTLKIHKLTQEQYDREFINNTLDKNALYLTPEEEIDLTPYATKEQLSGKADISHNHDDFYYTENEIDEKISDINTSVSTTYEMKNDAVSKLSEAKTYTDTVKNTILGEVTNDRNTLKKLSDLIDGETFNIQSQLDGKVSNATTVNGKALSSNISLTASDVGADASGSASDALSSANVYTDTAIETKMNKDNPVGTGSFSMNRKADTEIGNYSHAEGYRATALGGYSHAEGYYTEAIGDYSHAEGHRTKAGTYSHAEGCNTKAESMFSHAEGYHTKADTAQHVQGHYNNTSTATAGNNFGIEGTAFVIGNGTSTSGSNAFRVTYDGKPYSCSSMITSGADYAEFFEWLDLNPTVEDRRGYFVTLDEDKIKIAEPNDYILGIVSALPAVIGNGDECWRGRYILDDFGAFIIEEFEYEEEIFDKESGKIKTITKTGTKYKENPDYDPSLPYIQREDRPEWGVVGMMGVLAVRDDGTCEVNGYCKVTNGGIATASETGYRVIKRVSDNVIKIVFR